MADTRFDQALFEQLPMDGVDTIFHDCQLYEPGVVHPAYSELKTSTLTCAPRCTSRIMATPLVNLIRLRLRRLRPTLGCLSVTALRAWLDYRNSCSGLTP